MPFIIVFFLLPIFSFLIGWIEHTFLKNIQLIGVFNLLLWLLLTFTIFNRSFLIWAILNAMISTVTAYLLLRRRSNGR